MFPPSFYDSCASFLQLNTHSSPPPSVSLLLFCSCLLNTVNFLCHALCVFIFCCCFVTLSAWQEVVGFFRCQHNSFSYFPFRICSKVKHRTRSSGKGCAAFNGIARTVASCSTYCCGSFALLLPPVFFFASLLLLLLLLLLIFGLRLVVISMNWTVACCCGSAWEYAAYGNGRRRNYH